MPAGEHRFRDVFRHAPVGIAVVALNGEILEVNDAVAHILGYAPAELTGRTVWDFMHPDDRAGARRDAAATIAASGGHFMAERRYRRKDGAMTWVEMFAVLDRGPGGDPYFISQIIDLTERKRAEAALRASEERYRGIVESQQAAVMRVGLDFRIRFVNEHCTKIIGIAAADMVGQDFTQWICDDDRDAVIAAIASQIALPPHRAEAVSRVKCAGGAVRWFEWEGSAVLDTDGMPIEMQAVGRDVHERVLAEEALRASLDQLRKREHQLRLLAERQVSVREAERRRLGFDLHDGVCQELVGVGIQIELIRRRLEPLGHEGVAELGRVTRYVGEIVEHVRLLAGELRPMLLADLGLEGSLRSLTAGMTSETTAVRATFAGEIPRLEDGTEIGVYRIAQEALANALRHAHARNVDVALAVRDHLLRLEVHDDGCGFDPAARRAQALGLVSMEERAQALGGCFEVSSTIGHGTTVRLEVPLRAAAVRRSASS